MSSRYSPFDNEEVLRAIEPLLDRFELQRPHVDRDEMVLALTLRKRDAVGCLDLGWRFVCGGRRYRRRLFARWRPEKKKGAGISADARRGSRTDYAA